MSPSSTGDAPLSITGTTTRGFPLPTRDTFAIEIPSPQLVSGPNGVGALKSPTSIKTQRTPSFSRDGILGAAQKARNMSQSSENNSGSAVAVGGGRPESNGMQKVPSDDGINPLKRRNTDAGVDYPRRRATIAVCPSRPIRAAGRGSCLPAHMLTLTFFFLSLLVVRGLPVAKVSLRRYQAEM